MSAIRDIISSSARDLLVLAVMVAENIVDD
jgi:hypothetical protein